MQTNSWPRFETKHICEAAYPLPSSRAAGHIEQMGKQAINFHRESGVGGKIEATCILSSDIQVSGIGNLWLNGELANIETHSTSYWRSAVSLGKIDVGAENSLPLKVIDEVCISPLGWGNDIYGHVLIDLLPRLLLAKSWAKNEGVFAPKVLLPDSSPKWILPLLENFGVPRNSIIKFSPKKERVLLTRGIFPSYLYRSNGFHPVVAKLMDENFRHPNHSSDPRDGIIYISRLSIKREGARHCENESELIAIAQDEFGCTVLQPEDFDLPQQVEIFNKAFGVVGLYGSGLHTALLSDKGLRIGVVGMINLAQSHIAALRQQPISYFNEGIHVSGSYRVDADLFRWFMRGQLAPLKAHRDRFGLSS